MRIAFLTPEYLTEDNFSGGLANYLKRVAGALHCVGHHAIVVVASDRDEVLTEFGLEVVRVKVRGESLERWGWKLLRGWWPAAFTVWRSWKLNRRLQKLHHREPVDLVQYASYTATALFRLKKVPAVVRISSLEALWDSAYEQAGTQTLCVRAKYWLEGIALRNADLLISPSQIMADATREWIGREVKVVQSPYVAPDCVLEFGPYENSLEGKRYALFFGSVGLLKGVKNIAAILKTLLSEDPNLNFAFIGRDAKYLGRPMMDYVRREAGDCADRVHYFEAMRHDALYPFIQNAEVVVLPSRIDNLPNSCLEAMAQGRIVIGTRGASFDELIEDGVSGFLAEIDDSSSLLATVEKALAVEGDARRRMGDAARKRIASLSPEHSGMILLRVYSDLLKDSRPNSHCSEAEPC